MPACGEQLGVGELAPASIRGAFSHEHAIGCRVGPIMQAIGDPDGIIGKRRLRSKIDRAVALALDRNSGIAERDVAQRMRSCGPRRVACRAHAGFTLAVLRSRKSRMRRLASLSLCATV